MPEHAPADAADPEIHAERAFLTEARAALRRKHTDVVTTGAVQDSSEDMDATILNRLLQWDRDRRAEALVDFPNVPLFFGRLDFPPGAVFEAGPGDRSAPTRTPHADRVYIGRRHVSDGAGDPLVVDWRAPISRTFYRASREDPQGALLRRRFGFSESAVLTAYEDEPLTAPGGGPAASESELLAAEIERPRSGPMRDIVATIQPEQDDLVRSALRPALCVQGAPGTGKTAVGLHRIAYLLYTERDRLRQDGGVVIIGPNRSFLSYIRNVLPALGEVGVRQVVIEELIGGVEVRREEDPQAALLGETEDALEAARLVCVPATLAKGLEFDAVIVAEPDRIAAAEPRGLQRLYVVLTRAVSGLRIIHTAALPEPLDRLPKIAAG